MAGDRQVRRFEGYLGAPRPEFTSGGCTEVTFYNYTPPLTVLIGNRLLNEAGVLMVEGGVVVADVNPLARHPEEVNPHNLVGDSILPRLDRPLVGLRFRPSGEE